MLRTFSSLSRWFGPLAVLALFGLVPTRVVRAAATIGPGDTNVFAVKEVPTVAEDTSRAVRLNQRQAAASTWNATHGYDQSSTTIRVGSRVIMRFRASAGGLTAEQRQGIVQTRLINAMGHNYNRPRNVRVSTASGEPVIYLLGHQFVTVTRADALANGGTAMDLAQTWADNLRQGLGHMVQ